MSLEQKQWNVAAFLAVIVIVSLNIIGGAGFLMGKIDIQTLANFVSPADMMALGWFAHMLTTPGQQ